MSGPEAQLGHGWAGSLTASAESCLIAQGMSNAEIGDVLFLSEATVKTHVGRVLNKLGCRARVQAAVLAFRTGFIPRI